MSIINKLTEGIVRRDLSKEGAALLNKWEKTGLLEGISNERSRQGMAALLENQAKELLREASTMQGSDVEGFASVAFPIVRRVFGGLIANDLVSVQPMSLPSGLIFFLDFQLDRSRLGSEAGDSVYGGGVVGSQLTGGVSLAGQEAEESFYALNNGYSSPTGSTGVRANIVSVSSGTIGDNNWNSSSGIKAGSNVLDVGLLNDGLVRYDPDIAAGTAAVVLEVPLSVFTKGTPAPQFNVKDYVTITSLADDGETVIASQVRRLTRDSKNTSNTALVGDTIFLVYAGGTDPVTLETAILDATTGAVSASFVIDDNFADGGALGSIVGDEAWGLENNPNIPEIDIKVDSIAVTAKTKKLKAKWTPELAQDLNAYHNLDAEVELTSILSEHIALEIDQEILEDLVKGATAEKLYWSRLPGKFVNRRTGTAGDATTPVAYPDFTGNVSEWYETLAETINDVSAQIHRKTLRGGANFVVCSPEVANLLEFTAGFRGSVTHDDDRGEIGAVKVGSLSKKFDVYVDPYFPRNVVLVGRKGSSFLESGYVYAPYVPLQMTPTIFGTEDFVPRKGVMTRYAKKMVRPDMYGLVIVEDL
tara:strand:- start:6488 stop:8254 length:1767 start_codon:yes stop_codon:yes gene_type:complete